MTRNTHESPDAAVPLYPAHWAALGRLAGVGVTETGRTLGALGTSTITFARHSIDHGKKIAGKSRSQPRTQPHASAVGNEVNLSREQFIHFGGSPF
ncbi:hypothetical protein EVAR_52344_1 [Eumeta japonica]|uniref:Uncharacterized protein n=1 Tax=Eumeta variegata TaxID=151549 RepID=A0A4C1Y7A5_EUMVA|nr:hypothetical protein EVAR_52344_1 [Eumeta japonica]